MSKEESVTLTKKELIELLADVAAEITFTAIHEDITSSSTVIAVCTSFSVKVARKVFPPENDAEPEEKLKFGDE